MEDWIKRVYWFATHIPSDNIMIWNGEVWRESYLFESQRKEAISLHEYMDQKANAKLD